MAPIIVVIGHIQAGMPVIVERAERHAAVVDLHAILLRRLPAAYAVFYNFKKIHCTSISAQKTAACPSMGRPPFASYLMLISFLSPALPVQSLPLARLSSVRLAS